MPPAPREAVKVLKVGTVLAPLKAAGALKCQVSELEPPGSRNRVRPAAWIICSVVAVVTWLSHQVRFVPRTWALTVRTVDPAWTVTVDGTERSSRASRRKVRRNDRDVGRVRRQGNPIMRGLPVARCDGTA